MVTEQVRGKAKPDSVLQSKSGQLGFCGLVLLPFLWIQACRGAPALCRPLSEASGASSEQKNSQMLLLNAKPRGA